MKLFIVFALAATLILFLSDKDFHNASGYFLIIFSTVFGVVLAIVLFFILKLLKSKRPDLYNKWFPESEFEERLKIAKGNDFSAVSSEFGKIVTDYSLMGLIAGLIVMIFVFVFIWYAKTYLGW